MCSYDCNKMTRRTVLTAAGAAAASSTAEAQAGPLKGRLKQSVARWCYNKIGLEDLAKAASRMGLKGIDLVNSEDWPVLQKYGLVPAMTPGGGTIPDGLNRKENHDRIEREMRENISKAAAASVPNVITFSGNRRGLADDEGLDNCVIGLNRIKKIAEDKGVTICLELLNSKVDHKDYQCDHTAWGVEVVKRVDSPRVKLLYDIYHMQIMEGDIIRTIREKSSIHRSLSQRWRAGTARVGRHARAVLPAHCAGDRGRRFHRLLCARVYSHAGSARVTRRGRAVV